MATSIHSSLCHENFASYSILKANIREQTTVPKVRVLLVPAKSNKRSSKQPLTTISTQKTISNTRLKHWRNWNGSVSVRAAQAVDMESCPVSVWWDIENCGVPSEVEPGAIAGNIRRALAGEGVFGSLSISAYCDTHTLPFAVRKGLSASHVSLQDVPRGGKDSSDKAILVDMLLWALQHPPPAHMLLITNDQGFSKALHALRQLRYRVSISCVPSKEVQASLLRGAVNDEWEWPQMANGTCVALHSVPNVNSVTKLKACEVSPSEILKTPPGRVLNKPATEQQVPDVKNSLKPANGPEKKPNSVKNSPKPANGPEKKPNSVKNSSKPANGPDKKGIVNKDVG